MYFIEKRFLLFVALLAKCEGLLNFSLQSVWLMLFLDRSQVEGISSATT